MTSRQRLRRVGILCCHFLRNLAFYRAWFEAGKPNENMQLWVTVNGNFLDIAVLEWCKLFADVRGKHYFGKVVSELPTFKAQLFGSLHVTADEFDNYVSQIRTYRDKFVAHLDELNEMHIPNLDVAKGSAVFLYQHLLAHEGEDNVFHDAPISADALYQNFLSQGQAEYMA